MAVKKAKRKVVKVKAAKKVVKKPVKKVAKKTAKKVVVKKAAVVKKSGPKVNSVSKNYSKSQVLAYMADQACISKKEAGIALNAIDDLIAAHLKGSAGSFTLPGLLKCVVVRKPATKARKGTNPFTGEPTTFKAKPARNVVKIRALKRLKEIVK